MSPADNNGTAGELPAGALARAREALAAARGRQRLDVLLAADDPGALVSALPADELWFTIRDVGLAEATELVQLATPEQFRTFLDLECWVGDEVSPRRAFPWLRAARIGAPSDDEAEASWRAKLAAVDMELLELLLVEGVRVHDLDENPDPELESDRFMRTPENRYILEFTVGGTEYMALRGLVDDLYAEEPLRATRLMSALRFELRSDLEEHALRWRRARLSDLGYPTFEEALSWFARPPRAPAADAGAPERSPGFFLQRVPPGSLLERAVAGVDDERRQRVELELVTAANAVLVADKVDVHDVEAVRRAVDGARALVEMGLEELARGGEPAAALQATPVKRLFQTGFARLLDLRAEAERVLDRAGERDARAPLLDAPLGEALQALARRRPLYHSGLALEPAEWGHAAAGVLEARPFLARTEFSRARDAVRTASGLVDLGLDLGLVPARERPERIRLGALYLTALANERLGRGFEVAPIPSSDLNAAIAAVADVESDRLAGRGDAGALLTTLARAAAEELEPLRAGDVPSPGAESIAALWVA